MYDAPRIDILAIVAQVRSLQLSILHKHLSQLVQAAFCHVSSDDRVQSR